MQFIVVGDPPESDGPVVVPDRAPLKQTVIFDRSAWEPVEDDRDPSVVYVEWPLAFVRSGRWREVVVGDLPAVQYLWADDVRVGVTGEGTLASVGALCSSDTSTLGLELIDG